MSNDIVERLINYRPTDEWNVGVHHTICTEAAGEIASLRGRLEKALAVVTPPPHHQLMGASFITKEWFERRAKAEADLEIGAGFSVVNPTDADIAQMGTLAERALPQWAQDEFARLRTGIKRLSDEEELCAETTGDDPFSLVYLAAKLAAAEEESAKLAAEIERLRAAHTAPADIVMGGDLAQAGRDVRILLAQIDWLEELTGEKIEGEDAALVAQIRQAWAAEDQP